MTCHAVSTSNHLTTFLKHRSASPRKKLIPEAQVISENCHTLKRCRSAVAYRGGGFKPPLWNSEGPPKSCQTQTDCENYYKLLNLGHQNPKMFGKKGSKILKLPPVCNCFTLAMTNKLVVIINSLKVPKIKKILLYEIKFLVPSYSYFPPVWSDQATFEGSSCTSIMTCTVGCGYSF